MDGTFRLHCEELTGQTDDPAARQRRFRGVIMSDGAGKRVVPERDTIDLLAVTTTMEVGVDIGPLRAVFQANMPPQRFNYQQRVGRAGRRGQAFSMVVTVCRTRSHDLYYFQESLKITGDVPPPPFLTKRMPDIAKRFLRKWWLNAAFTKLRASHGVAWPADGMRPPDIHGEFLPTVEYDDVWRTRLLEALTSVEPEAQRVAELLRHGSELKFEELWMSASELIEEIDELKHRPDATQSGLAHSLAELGKLPMYGMPTRSRNLYIGTKIARTGSEEEWIKIDRDLDVAVFEFAPGALVRKDKMAYRSIGFTGAMRGFSYRKKENVVNPLGDPFGQPFWLLECQNCNAWYHFDSTPNEELPECEACGEQLSKEFAAECREPLGFRTNFRRGAAADRDAPLNRHRSLIAETGAPRLVVIENINVSASVRSGRLYRLNRGEADPAFPGAWQGFHASRGEDRNVRGDLKATFSKQWLDPAWVDDRSFGVKEFKPEGGDDAIMGGVWLAAGKTTDLLSVSPTMVHRGLDLANLVGSRSLEGLDSGQCLRALASTAIRSAALSASFILATRAAEELDIDPEEFDVLDPRIARVSGGTIKPILQIADHLINGAGFVRALESNGWELLRTIVSSVVSDETKYPLNVIMSGDHEERCAGACYRCLLRYRNQSYHGLLDWRLGLAYLAALNDSDFTSGLVGEFASHPFLRSWESLV
ncbi:helicase-related protein [Gemmatimonas sp.]|uniref:helicase-related protein n=1 Tax=Gemmatimonas sp. TaxID=1962908 RepID=UPI003564BD9F